MKMKHACQILLLNSLEGIQQSNGWMTHTVWGSQILPVHLKVHFHKWTKEL